MNTETEYDTILASAVNYLIQGNDLEAASVLLPCTLEGYHHGGYAGDDTFVVIHIRGPRVALDVLQNQAHPLHSLIVDAIGAALPHGYKVGGVEVRAEMVALDSEWRAELIGIARGKSVTNNSGKFTWNNLKFASPPEMRIAEALDAKGVMFFPSAKGRLNDMDGRSNRIPDFLVCHNGKWGILEVDGGTYHPPTRTVHDHARDELFHQHGVRVVRHYDARECQETPEFVVDKFLALLAKHYD